MTKASSNLHFPADIKLNNRPLVEAWLDIRWELEHPDPQQPQALRDPSFAFALGKFYESIKHEFGHKDDLPVTATALEIPYVVRHQFRPSKDKWPILQLGPGVASINFTDPYTWDMFKQKALYLRSKLIKAYSETKLKAQKVTLQYRNAIPFEFSSEDLLTFLKSTLNTSIKLPAYIPGNLSATERPSGANIVLTFKLKEPNGEGAIGLATAITKKKDPKTDQEVETEIVLLDLGVNSVENNAPDLYDEDQFVSWLTSAHIVTHEWFFSLVDGSLRQQYDSKGK